MRKTPSIKGSFVAPHRLFRGKKKAIYICCTKQSINLVLVKKWPPSKEHDALGFIVLYATPTHICPNKYFAHSPELARDRFTLIPAGHVPHSH